MPTLFQGLPLAAGRECLSRHSSGTAGRSKDVRHKRRTTSFKHRGYTKNAMISHNRIQVRRKERFESWVVTILKLS